MRIGSAIVFLVAILFGSGYLFSDNIHTRKDLTEANQQIAKLLSEKNAIQGQLENANSEIATLKAQKNQLIQQVLVRESQIKQIQEENLRIKNQYAQLQSQFDQMIKLNPLTQKLIRLLPRSLKLALFLPILPVSLVVTFVVYRNRRHHNGSRNDHSSASKRNVAVQLTEEEMKEIIKMRRAR